MTLSYGRDLSGARLALAPAPRASMSAGKADSRNPHASMGGTSGAASRRGRRRQRRPELGSPARRSASTTGRNDIARPPRFQGATGRGGWRRPGPPAGARLPPRPPFEVRPIPGHRRAQARLRRSRQICSRGHQLRAAEQAAHLLLEIGHSGLQDPPPGDEHHIGSSVDLGGERSPGLPKNAPGPVALDRAAHPPAGHERRCQLLRPRPHVQYHPASGMPPAPVQRASHSPTGQGATTSRCRHPSDPWGGVAQADSRVRPLERRRARMARPARVRIRTRNPCRFLRRRVLG
jgi:hypothetical protein